MCMERVRPELSIAVNPFLPGTIQDAIDRAKAYEMTYSRGGTLSAYSAEQFMPNIPGMNQGVNQPLQGLIDQLLNLMKGNNNVHQRPKIENRSPVTCYNCKQQGHIKPNCPQLSN